MGTKNLCLIHRSKFLLQGMTTRGYPRRIESTRRSAKKWMSLLDPEIHNAKMLTSDLRTFMWILIIPIYDRIVCGSVLNLFISVIPPGYSYHAGYRIKTKLICRLTKDRDQTLISISITQEFPALVIFEIRSQSPVLIGPWTWIKQWREGRGGTYFIIPFFRLMWTSSSPVRSSTAPLA